MYCFENPGEKTGTISNMDAFLHKGLNTEFPTKWTGLWTPGYKLLDYYAYKVNGLWLNDKNLQRTEYGDKIIHYFETESLKIKEEISMPEQLAGMASKLEITNKNGKTAAAQVSLEAGVDIRPKNQDLGPEKYEVEKDSGLKVDADKQLSIDSSHELLFEGSQKINEHFPGEKQRCMIPGEIITRVEIKPGETEKIKFQITSGKASEKSMKQKPGELYGKLGKTFNSSISSCLNMIYDRKGLGVIAGHPWFQNYWARDTFWTLLGLIDAGYFEEAEEILENFADKDLPGKINLESMDEAKTRSDTYPLFIIASDKLRRHYKISDKIENGMQKAFEHLGLEDGVAQHDPEGTWMDTLERPGAVDVQCLWKKASEIMNGPEIKLERYENPEYISDHLGKNAPETINPSVGLIYDHFNPENLEKINAEFSSRYGARTRSVTDPGYESAGYHTGSSWGLTTCWAAMANFKHGKTVEGLNYLEKLEKLLDRDQPGALPEVLDSETGKNFGCVEQAWSAGLFIHSIDSYLLGIKVEEDKIIIDPCDGYRGLRKSKRIGDEFLDIKIEDGNAEVLNRDELNLDKELIL